MFGNSVQSTENFTEKKIQINCIHKQSIEGTQRHYMEVNCKYRKTFFFSFCICIRKSSMKMLSWKVSYHFCYS